MLQNVTTAVFLPYEDTIGRENLEIEQGCSYEGMPRPVPFATDTFNADRTSFFWLWLRRKFYKDVSCVVDRVVEEKSQLLLL